MRIKSKPLPDISIFQAMEESMLSFRKIRRLKPLEDNNFVIENSNAMLESLTNMLNNVGAGTSSIGILTLIGAVVALTNIMLVSVTERTREIGIRKSLGASSKMVMTQFLMEAIIISVLGGIFGIIFGIAIGNLVAYFLSKPVLYSVVLGYGGVYHLYCYGCPFRILPGQDVRPILSL